MKFLEKDLEQIIYDTPNDHLGKRGLYIFGNKLRQVRIGNYGIADLITIRRDYESSIDFSLNTGDYEYTRRPKLVISVYEFKKDEVDLSTYHQAIRYVRGIMSYLDKRKFFQHVEYEIFLVGRSICEKSVLPYLPAIHQNINIYTYDYDFNGLSFKRIGEYFLEVDGFNTKGTF